MENSTSQSADRRILEGCLLLVISVGGLVCNLLSFLVLIRHRSFRNPFGCLAAYHALCNFAILLIFVSWAVPWTIIMVPQQLQSLNLRVGQLSIFFFETAFHCCLFVSINRLMAINFPLLYRRIFTDATTMGIVIFVSVLSAIYTSVYFKAGCDFYFDHERGVWSFGSEPCSVWLSFYIDLCYNVFLFLTIIVIDITTLVQLKLTTRSMLSRSVQKDDRQNNDMSSKRRRKELLLFTQTFINSLMYAFMLLCFHLIAPLASTDFQLFLCTTLVWGLSHTIGGVILIVFNPEVRRHIVNFRDISRSLHEQATTVITVKLTQPTSAFNQKMYQ